MGMVYIVGAGPGDRDFITVKGLVCIQKADVILYDRLVNKELLNEAKPYADLIYCGKTPHAHTMKQEEINQLLVKHAKAGKIVTRLKGGDPFVFGRGAEEAEFLVKHQITYEVIPGITSGIAVPAYAGIPVTHRDVASSFAIIPGYRKEGENEDSIDWHGIAHSVDTLAIYMGVSNLPHIVKKLVAANKSLDTPVAIIEQGTTECQKVTIGTLKTIVDQAYRNSIENPAMIIVGEVVNLRNKLINFETITTQSVISV